MKKRFLSLITALVLTLSLCSLTAFADDLTLDFYNVVTSGLTLEFSNELTRISGSITQAGESIPLITSFSIDESNKKAAHVTISSKMDITETYLLYFEASDGTNTLSKEMVIKFNVVVNDDFSSYSSLEDMKTNYVGRIDGSAPEVTDSSLGFEFDNANKRVKLTLSDKFLRNKNVAQSYYSVDFDIESVDGVSYPPYMMHVRCVNGEFVNYCRILAYNTGYFEFFNDPAGTTFSLPESELKSKKSYTVTRKKYDNTNSYFSICSDDKLTYSFVSTKDQQYNSHFAISAWGTPVYLDNLKVYTAELSDYTPIALSGTNEYFKDHITVGFNQTPVSATAEIKCGTSSVSASVKCENKSVVITPSAPFDFDKTYKISLTANDGINSVSFDKVFKLEKLYAEDFNSYTADTFRAKYTNDGLEFDETNKRAKLVKANGTTDFQASAAAEINKPIITEFEAETVKNTATTDPTGLFLDIGFGENRTTLNSWYFYNQYANIRYGIYGGTTVSSNSYAPTTVAAPSKVKMTFEASNPLGTGTFNIYQNGALKTSATDFTFNTYSSSNKQFSIIMALAGLNYYTYLDNIYMYSPVVYDPADIPAVTLDSCEITSKFIKVDFSESVMKDELETAVSLTRFGEKVATNMTLENGGKTLKIKPASGALDLDTEYVFKIDGLHDDFYTKLNFYQKRFMLEKLWTENFENCETLNDLNGDYKVAMVSAAPESIIDNSANFAIDTEANGNKRLKLVSYADNGAFTHNENYPNRENWTNAVLEVDIATDSTWNLDIFYKMIYSSGNFSGWWDGTSALRFYENWTQNMVPATGALSPEYPGMNTDKESSLMFVPQNGKFNVYKNGETYISQDYNPETFPVGEFGFRINNSNGVAQYIDNIKCYKVIDNSEDQIFIAGMKKTNSAVSGTIALNSNSDANVPESVLLVAVYDSNNKMLGISKADIDGKFKTSYIPYEVEYEGGTPVTVRAFLWSSINSMSPVAANAMRYLNN